MENNFEGKNDKVLEIVSGISCYGLLKRSGNNNLKVFLSLDLCIGKLDSIKEFKRDELKEYVKYVSTINDGPFKNGFDFEYEFKKIKSFNNVNKIRVWSSHLDCNDYCLLLFICNFFGDKNISVVYSEEYNWYATTCTALAEKEIKDLLKKEHLLKKYEIEQYKEEWKKIVDENTELRFMINGSVKSVDINYFDNEIMERLKTLGEVNIHFLIANLMGNPIIPFVHYSDYIYLYLINRLIDSKFIKKIQKENKIFVKLKEEKLKQQIYNKKEYNDEKIKPIASLEKPKSR